MVEQQIRFKLHPAQIAVWENPSRFRVLVAGRRFGKTYLAVTELILSAMSTPNSLLWYISPSYRQSKMIAWRLFKNIIPTSMRAKYNEAELSIIFPNGSAIELKGADNEDNLRGAGLYGCVIDEFASIYDNWTVWHEVLRPMLTDKQGWVLFIGTPKGKDAFWELYMKGVRNEDGYASWQFTTKDNPFINPQEVDEARNTMPDRYYRQEYEASFEDYVGLVYPEFSEDKHVIQPIYIPEKWTRVGAIDPAITGITGALKGAIDDVGKLYIYEEYYEADRRVSEVAQVIKSDIKWYIDPAAQGKTIQRNEKTYSLIDEYAEHGIRTTPAENDISSGINRIGELFKRDNIAIFSTCRNLIWELERYHWVEPKETANGIAEPKPFHKDCHLCDCLKSIVLSRPDWASFTEKDDLNPNSAWGRYMLSKRNKNSYIYAGG